MKARPMEEALFASITHLVRTRSGLVFGPSRLQQAEAGIRQTMEAVDTSDPDRFLALLHSDPRAFQALIENLTVAETYFFREPDQFDVLRRQIVPELRRGLVRGEPLRLWSAGCASGEEAYSLAILLDQENLVGAVHVLATDISRSALALARNASYGPWSFRDCPPDLVARYFRRNGERLTVLDRIRRSVAFDTFNLASEIYPCGIVGAAGLDLILCRNVLIYFDPATIARVAQNMFASLKDGGWLMTGPSDPPLWQHAPFETLLTPGGVLYRRREADKPVARATVDVPLPAVTGGGLANRHAAGLSEKPETRAYRSPTPRRRAVEPGRPQPAAVAPDGLAQLRAFADRGEPGRFANAVTDALAADPLSAEMHFLQAIVLMGGGRYEEAAVALRRVIYLDRTIALAHFALAAILQRRGAIAEARRCYRNVLAVCDARRADDIVPLSDGEPTRHLVEAVRAQLALIPDSARSSP